MKKTKMKKGFTIIETLLAMTGVAFLMVSIAVLTINISRMYHKGTTIKAVNETGRAVLDDFKRSIASSPVLNENDDDLAGGGTFRATPYFNEEFRRFCTGRVSYIWNLGARRTATGSWESDNTDPESNGRRWRGYVNRIGGPNGEVARLVKVDDHNREYCKLNPSGNLPSVEHIQSAHNPVELLGESAESIILYDFVIFANRNSRNINTANGQVFYSGSFVLGTSSTNISNASGGIDTSSRCLPPNNVHGHEYYCSINKFNFAQRAMGSAL